MHEIDLKYCMMIFFWYRLTWVVLHKRSLNGLLLLLFNILNSAQLIFWYHILFYHF